HGADVGARLPRLRAAVRRLGRLLAGPRGEAVGGQPRDTDLDADVPPALVHQLPGLPGDVLERRAAGVAVGVHGPAALAAPELVDRQPRPLAGDVPQGHVRPADGVAQDRAVAPVGADEGRLPDVLDLQRVLADEERLEVLLDRRLYHAGPLGEGRTAQAV